MLGSYMEDIGIKSDQFQKIFGGKEKRETNPAIHPFLFEQVRDIQMCPLSCIDILRRKTI